MSVNITLLKASNTSWDREITLGRYLVHFMKILTQLQSVLGVLLFSLVLPYLSTLIFAAMILSFLH